MASGFTSKYKDAGYTLPTGDGWTDQANQPVNSITNADIYITTQQTGVYMFNGSNLGGSLYPIVSSIKNMNVGGGGIYSDNGWIVYPGWGFQLYNAVNYVGPISNLYINTTNLPVYFGFASGTSLPATYIIYLGGTYTGADQTASVKIYFRGTEIKMSPLY